MAWEDPLAYPGTGGRVLKNKVDIKDAAALREFEYAVANVRLAELHAKPIKGEFDLQHLKAIHHHLLKDVYDWAGKTRDEVYPGQAVRFGKGGTSFVHQDEIKPVAKVLFDHLKRENHLRGNEDDKEHFVNRLTEYYAGLNKIHPFREGNGRSTQTFIAQLATQAGYELDYRRVDKATWNEAARLSSHGEREPMKEVFERIAVPHRALAFEQLDKAEAVKRHPELADAFAAKAAMEKHADQAGFSAEQRRQVSQQIQANLVAHLESGSVPRMALRDAREATTSNDKDFERR